MLKIVERFSVVMAGVLMMALAGCATVGNEKMRSETQATVDSKLFKGKTTKSEVLAFYGSADDITLSSDGSEVWKYKFSNVAPKPANFIPFVGALAGGSDLNSKTLVVLFNEQGVIKAYTFSATENEIRTGIINANQ